MKAGDGRDLAGHLAELHLLMTGVESVERTLARVATLTTRTVPGCDHCSVTLVDGGTLSTVASAPDVTALDRRQYELADGPCDATLRTGVAVDVRSVADDDRWPEYLALARELGIGSVLSLPLRVLDATIGVLNLFSCTPDGMADAGAVAQLFAEQAAVALANARSHRAALTLVSQLEEAMERRGAIEQAKGILMATHRITADEAFEMLRRTSQNANRKLYDIARQVVDRVAAGDLPG